jgi:glycosyltransferase involved in cell wall biosynthesis
MPFVTSQPAAATTKEVDAATLRLSVVIPCLNEAENIQECVRSAQSVLMEHGISGEVLVVDNGSEDGSGELARAAGATVIDERRRGYGQAYLTGFAAARGEYIVMADADLTYDFAEIPRFVKELDDGADLVMGNRMQNIQPGAMSIVSRIGNPIMTSLLRFLFRSPVGDVQCGMRALRRNILPQLDLRATGFEFASEMVLRAAREDVEIREFPIALHPRGGHSKLSPFRDGWRNLRLMLAYSPDFLFIVPGVVMVLLGLVIVIAVLAKASVFGRQLSIHTEIAGCLLINVGVEVLAFGAIARTYGLYFMGARDPLLERLRARFKLEHGLLAGGVLILAGLVGGIVLAVNWIANGAGPVGEGEIALLAATGMVAGAQVFFASFVVSILGLRRPR